MAHSKLCHQYTLKEVIGMSDSEIAWLEDAAALERAYNTRSFWGRRSPSYPLHIH